MSDINYADFFKAVYAAEKSETKISDAKIDKFYIEGTAENPTLGSFTFGYHADTGELITYSPELGNIELDENTGRDVMKAINNVSTADQFTKFDRYELRQSASLENRFEMIAETGGNLNLYRFVPDSVKLAITAVPGRNGAEIDSIFIDRADGTRAAAPAYVKTQAERKLNEVLEQEKGLVSLYGRVNTPNQGILSFEAAFGDTVMSHTGIEYDIMTGELSHGPLAGSSLVKPTDKDIKTAVNLACWEIGMPTVFKFDEHGREIKPKRFEPGKNRNRYMDI